MRKWNNTQALREGWDLFEVDGRLQLQKSDERDVFESDTAALLFVAMLANGGFRNDGTGEYHDPSEYHREALEMIGTLAGRTYNTEPLTDELVQIGQWRVAASKDYLYVARVGKPGDVHIKADVEGFVVDVYDDAVEEVKATLSVEYVELLPQEDRNDQG